MRRDPSYLVDILLAARSAVKFADGLTRQQFEQDALHRYAIMKVVEIVGEAASRLSTEAKDELPEIEWNKVIGMRRRLVHDYFAINYERVLEVVQHDLPKLILKLEAILPPEPDQSN